MASDLINPLRKKGWRWGKGERKPSARGSSRRGLQSRWLILKLPPNCCAHNPAFLSRRGRQIATPPFLPLVWKGRQGLLAALSSFLLLLVSLLTTLIRPDKMTSKADVTMYEKNGSGGHKHDEDFRSTPSPQQGLAVSLLQL